MECEFGYLGNPITLHMHIRSLSSENNTVKLYYNYIICWTLYWWTVLIYCYCMCSGDIDGRVPVTSTKNSLKKMKLRAESEWYPWFLEGEAGGYAQKFERNLTFATVRGAGHQVPSYQPARALSLLMHFVAGTDLPNSTRHWSMMTYIYIYIKQLHACMLSLRSIHLSNLFILYMVLSLIASCYRFLPLLSSNWSDTLNTK